MNEPTLFPTTPRFAGAVFDPAFDQERLTKQLGRVFDTMRDGAWRTLQEIADQTGDPQASISAQLRHLRKRRFGAYIIAKQRRGQPERGLYEYRLVVGNRVDPKESR
jgi:hypothetical protein